MTKRQEQIPVYKDLMGANEEWAQKTRDLLAEQEVKMFNLIGSPGSGKTRLLEATANRLGDGKKFAVLEGDVETVNDAERLHNTGAEVSQLLSGGACHLEAKLVHHALKDLDLENLDLVFVENVGNLVCPAEFDVGENAKIAVLSVTEGEDKPEKYPLLFREAEALVITKTDLLPFLDFDLQRCINCAQTVNPSLPIFETKLAGEDINLSGWPDWLYSVKE